MSELLTTFDNALKEFAVRAACWHSMAADYKAGRQEARTTLPELRQWIETTRSLADRLPCGGEALRTLLGRRLTGSRRSSTGGTNTS